ncbi:MAG TPA: Wzz/FepE/Etk N-terminal domain-containing protein [Terriglobales bacterium]|nr:Wzz/FepE/Etk N-terminal domain-containing protein [Terriglobales bacterium]
MQQELIDERMEQRPGSLTARDLAAILFRQKKILLLSFVVILLGIVLTGVLMPKYQAQMKILVRRDRVDPVVSSQPNTLQLNREEVTEAELNSEVELLNSSDLLRKAVLATGLADEESGSEQVRTAKAVRQLAKRLQIEPLRKTNVIAVSYESSDPAQAAKVLNTLASLYTEKHLEVHRPSGEFKFFDQQAEQYRKELELAEQRLTDFTRRHGTVAAQMERDITLQKLSEFEVSYRQTQAAIAETEQRIRALEQQQTSLPGRLTTQVRTSDNPVLLQQLKSTLLNLELKRTELLTKFDPNYRLVQELDKQIADTRAAIAAEDKAPVREQTTDQNPTSLWVNSEMARARTDLSALKAKAAATSSILSTYRQTARELQESSVEQQDLMRAVKTAEDNYLLYQRKEEEARINDALDQRGILNVAIAEQPTVPALPVRSSLLYGLLSVFLAGTASLGMAFTSDFLDPSFRTPTEVNAFMGAPVLASIPKGEK